MRNHSSNNRNRKLLISRAPTKAKSQEPAYSQALNQNKIDRQRSRLRDYDYDQDPESQAGRQLDGYGGWCLYRFLGRHLATNGKAKRYSITHLSWIQTMSSYSVIDIMSKIILLNLVTARNNQTQSFSIMFCNDRWMC